MRQWEWKIIWHAISAECILRGVRIMVEEGNIGLKDVILTHENLRRMVAMGWAALAAVYREKMQAAKEGTLELLA